MDGWIGKMELCNVKLPESKSADETVQEVI